MLRQYANNFLTVIALFSIQQTALLTFINTNPNPNHSPNPSPVAVPKHRGWFAGWKKV